MNKDNAAVLRKISCHTHTHSITTTSELFKLSENAPWPGSFPQEETNWHVTDKAPPFVFVAQCHRQAVQSDTCFTGAFGPQDHCVYTACLHQIFITSFQRGDLSKRRVGTGTITCKCTDRKTDVWPQLHAQVPAELEVKAALHSGPRSVPAADTIGFSFPSSSLHTRPAVLSNVSCSHNHK